MLSDNGFYFSLNGLEKMNNINMLAILADQYLARKWNSQEKLQAYSKQSHAHIAHPLQIKNSIKHTIKCSSSQIWLIKNQIFIHD